MLGLNIYIQRSWNDALRNKLITKIYEKLALSIICNIFPSNF